MSADCSYEPHMQRTEEPTNRITCGSRVSSIRDWRNRYSDGVEIFDRKRHNRVASA